jgi:hypothetical protein
VMCGFHNIVMYGFHNIVWMLGMSEGVMFDAEAENRRSINSF